MKYHQGKFTPENPQKYIGNTDTIFYRSSWEKRVMLFFDKNPSILKWNSEEVVIPYISPVDNRAHRYFVDFAVKYKTRSGEIKSAIVEVKPEVQTKRPVVGKKKSKTVINEAKTYAINMSKWEAASQYAKKRGMEFMVLTERDLNIK